MDLDLPPIPAAERTPLVETLLGIIDLLHQRVHTLEATVQQLRDEIAVLKGQSPRPKIAPSQLTKPTPPPPRQTRSDPDRTNAPRTPRSSPRSRCRFPSPTGPRERCPTATKPTSCKNWCLKPKSRATGGSVS